VEGVQGKPTAQSYQVFDELTARLDQQFNWLKQVYDRDLPQFNDWARRLNQQPIVVPAKPVT
jgi:hypothetical protein